MLLYGNLSPWRFKGRISNVTSQTRGSLLGGHLERKYTEVDKQLPQGDARVTASILLGFVFACAHRLTPRTIHLLPMKRYRFPWLR